MKSVNVRYIKIAGWIGAIASAIAAALSGEIAIAVGILTAASTSVDLKA